MIPHAEAQIRVRKAPGEVFNAFIDPEVTKNFWFTKGSGIMEVAKRLTWEWEMYDISFQVMATEIVENEKLVFHWFTGEHPTVVEMNFKALSDGTTFLHVKQTGFTGDSDAILAEVRNSTSGFAYVLCGLKVFLEHGFNPDIIVDVFPKEVGAH